ncbi:MAG: efflux RND transporter periplasmic adaptor subunit [Verrucomicrobia bacterium]|nr:efflux RND transporter periplasmic adaptor subunit [Verrucomicrobiota bacterium]
MILVMILLFSSTIPIFSNPKKIADAPMEKMSKDIKPVQGYAEVQIDPEKIQLFGITTEKLQVRDLSKTIRTVGLIEVDERRIANVQTKFNGWIEKLFVNFTGALVANGEPLFSVYSPDLLTAQEEYLLALKGEENPVQGMFGEELTQSNEDLLDAARRRLELWDVPEQEIKRLTETRVASKTLTIDSPVEGIVLTKNAFVGMNVEPGMNIFTIADLSHVWVMADIYEQDISWIKIGQNASLSLTSFSGKSFIGSVAFISYVVEPSTRTMKVRFDFDNPNKSLKPGMYATVEIQINMGKSLAVPESAVIDTGLRKIVFVSPEKGRYEPREVQLGFKAGPYYQVISGLKENESVATSAQFLLDSESRIKAGAGGMAGMETMKQKKNHD